MHGNTLRKWGRLTSVGHEHLQARVLEQVAAGEDRPDLTEHPFTVKTLRVRQDLREEEREREGGVREGGKSVREGEGREKERRRERG